MQDETNTAWLKSEAMVLNAAETIIIEEGFAALTIRKIAMEMVIPWAVFTWYLPVAQS